MTFPRLIIPILFFASTLLIAAPAVAQDHAAAPSEQQQPLPTEKGAHPAHPGQTTESHGEKPKEHANETVSTIARLFNFAILVGVLVYFLKSPLVGYLASRSAQIRQDLVTASEMRAAAAAQLAEIQARMATLPGELEALQHQGAADVTSEQARIAEAGAHERERLLTQTRREIEMRLRIAKRELTEHAAALAVQVAEQRIKRVITPDDQVRLIDRYAAQLREAR
ncbi:MAG: ATP synthase F0 subunit B [Vicinamibacterales bacterium]